ncbi:exodeoxyribonuclease I subunit D domain protein, partial [Vibrio parahaemolyticus V-223/04]
MKPIK